MSCLASDRLLNSLSLRKLLAGNNRLQRVPDLLDHVPLEALDLQHNKLAELPESLFYKALKWVSQPPFLCASFPVLSWCLLILLLESVIGGFLCFETFPCSLSVVADNSSRLIVWGIKYRLYTTSPMKKKIVCMYVGIVVKINGGDEMVTGASLALQFPVW